LVERIKESKGNKQKVENLPRKSPSSRPIFILLNNSIAPECNKRNRQKSKGQKIDTSRNNEKQTSHTNITLA